MELPHEQISSLNDQVEVSAEQISFLNNRPECDLLGGGGIFKTELRECIASATPQTVTAVPYHDAPCNLKACHWLRAQYDAPPKRVAKALTTKLPNLFINAISADDAATHVLIHTSTQQHIRPSLHFGMLGPKKVEVATFSQGRGRNQAKIEPTSLLSIFQQLPGKHVTNMHLCKTADSEEYTAKTLFAAVKDMTTEAYLECILEATLKMENGADVSELERLLCDDKIVRRAKELRQAYHKAMTKVLFASKMKEFGQVEPESCFKSSWKDLQVTIHDTSLLTPLMPQKGNPATLQTFLDFKELHQDVTLFIPGKTRKGQP